MVRFCVCLFSLTFWFLTDGWMGWLYLIHWHCKALTSLTAIINGFKRWNKCCSMVHWAEWRAVPSPVSLHRIYLMIATARLDQKCFWSCTTWDSTLFIVFEKATKPVVIWFSVFKTLKCSFIQQVFVAPLILLLIYLYKYMIIIKCDA